MTPTQVLYFLTAAESLNITQAARRLYITQPALSKQITAIENELNMQLFLRDKKSLRLTPAGEVLMREFPAYLELYDEIISKARAAYQGYSGTLKVGVLDGHSANNPLRTVLSSFSGCFPNVDVTLVRHSFETLRTGLYRGELDIAITLSFDILDCAGLKWHKLENSPALIAMLRSHPLADAEPLTAPLLKSETFIVPQDSEGGRTRLFEFCAGYGFRPQIKFAPNLNTIMLWVETGIGIAVLNSKNALCENRSLIFRELPGLGDTEVVAVWNPDNLNFAVGLFLGVLKQTLPEVMDT